MFDKLMPGEAEMLKAFKTMAPSAPMSVEGTQPPAPPSPPKAASPASVPYVPSTPPVEDTEERYFRKPGNSSIWIPSTDDDDDFAYFWSWDDKKWKQSGRVKNEHLNDCDNVPPPNKREQYWKHSFTDKFFRLGSNGVIEYYEDGEWYEDGDSNKELLDGDLDALKLTTERPDD